MESQESKVEGGAEEPLDLTSKVYKLVVEHGKEGVLQSMLWKELGLTSRDGSRLAIRLEKRGMIRREKLLDGGRWTYRLTPLRLPVEIKSIENSPCITCTVEVKCASDGLVTPYTCIWLADWAIHEHTHHLQHSNDDKKICLEYEAQSS